MEYIEEVGVYLGDFLCLLLLYLLLVEIQVELCCQVVELVKVLNVVGLMNIQFVIQISDEGVDIVYLLEVNLCVLCIVLFVFKVIGMVLVKIVVCCMVGKILVEQGVIKEIVLDYYLVKEVIFLFVKFQGVDLIFGLEMCFIGEVMGVGCIFNVVFVCVQEVGGIKVLLVGKVFVLVCDLDKKCVLLVVKVLLVCGYSLVVICGIVVWLQQYGMDCEIINKVVEGCLYIVDLIKNGEIVYIVNMIEGCLVINDLFLICCEVLQYCVIYLIIIVGVKVLVDLLEFRGIGFVWLLQELYKELNV